MKKTILIIFLFIIVSFQLSAQWEIVNTQFQNIWLYDVHMISNTVAWAVGYPGTIIKTTDGGATWFPQASGTTNTLWGVSFVNENFGTAVGDAGIILNTTDGGAHWNLQSSGTTKNFEKVHFSDINNGTAVGYDSLVIRTTNGGSTWNF